MSEEKNHIDSGTISRREALAAGAKVAGAAAFATPMVMGVFSSKASAAVPDRCNPSVDSNAIDLLSSAPRKWNTNCADDTKFGRYNAQRTEAVIEGTTESVAINFGFYGTDNYPHECSFYWFETPPGWECTATFVTGDANEWGDEFGSGGEFCPDGALPYESNIDGLCEVWPSDNPDNAYADLPGLMSQLKAQIGADNVYPVPYCGRPVPNHGNDPDFCESKTFLWLVEWVCCPPV